MIVSIVCCVTILVISVIVDELMAECSKNTFTFLGRGSAHVVLGDNRGGDAIRIFIKNALGTKSNAEFVSRHVQNLDVCYGKYLPKMTCCPIDIEARNTLATIDGIDTNIFSGEIEWGLKVCNMMKMWLPLPSRCSHENVVTVELKPKSAALFAARSLLVGVEYAAGGCTVHRGHDMKYTNSRFAMNQFHKKTKHGHLSTFSPSLLFETSTNGISIALRQLMDAPQNNFKIFINGESFDMDVGVTARPSRDEQLAAQLFEQFGEMVGSQPIDWFLTQIEEVLKMERELLNSVVLMQERDVLDVEGAALVLHRLMKTHSQSDALGLINEALCGQEGKLVAPPDSDSVEALAWYADQPIPSEETRRSAFEYIESLDDEMCVQLLANWLLSLAACDISIMTSFTTIHHEGDVELTSCPQREESAGVIRPTDKSIGKSIAYCIGLTDLGPKDSDKIISKAIKEKKFCQEALVGLNLP